MTKWIKKGAKEEQQKRMKEQVGAVQDKMNKWANRIVVGGFYKKKEEVERKEGDVWEDDEGRTWTVKNGYKQTISIFESIRMPWWCPRCERPLNHKIHEDCWRMRGACHDCVIKYETKMRVAGVWDAYERREKRKNEKDWIKDKIQEHESYIKGFRTPQLHFSNGGWEELASKGQFEMLFEELRKDVIFLKERTKQIEKEELEDELEQNKLSEWEHDNPWN